MIPLFSNAECLAYGVVDLNLAEYEKEFNLWLNEMEEAAAYRNLIAEHAHAYRN
jgi:hypothetical protein